MRWIEWLDESSPYLKEKVRHLHIWLSVRAPGIMADERTYERSQRHEYGRILMAFPNLTSVGLQVYLPAANGAEMTEERMAPFVERVVRLAEYWKKHNMRVNVFPDQCAGSGGRKVIAVVQERLGQRQIEPSIDLD